LLARRFDDGRERAVVVKRRLLVIGGDGSLDLRLIGRHLGLEKGKEIELLGVIELIPGNDHITGERHARRLPLLGQEITAVTFYILTGFPAAPQIEELAPGIGNGVEKLGDKSRWHLVLICCASFPGRRKGVHFSISFSYVIVSTAGKSVCVRNS